MVDKPGMASNFPIGETGGAVDLEGTNGVYVVDGAIGMIGRVDKPVKITIEKGIAIKIEGGEAADKLRAILGKADQEYKKAHPEDKVASAYRLAEFAFGMNSKAFRYEDGKRVSPPTSLEGEKGLGTVHIALGKNTLFGVPKEDPDYNDIPIHIDCVAMEPNVVGIKDKEEEIDIIEKGEVVCI
jgi:leucyl aminopeptidase (aminopeptidase T)